MTKEGREPKEVDWREEDKRFLSNIRRVKASRIGGSVTTFSKLDLSPLADRRASFLLKPALCANTQSSNF